MRIAFIGLGEAAGAFITGWGADRASDIAAFDIKTTISETAPEISDRAKAFGITHCITLRDAVSDADVVFSTVTADQAITAARAAAPDEAGGLFSGHELLCTFIKTGVRWVYGRAQYALRGCRGNGAVYPKQLDVPLLISGDWSDDVSELLSNISLTFRIIDGPVGRASSIKMVRSIMVKGLRH